MRLVKPSFEIIQFPENAEQNIELAARNCYKSEDKITNGSAEKLTKMLMDRNHNAMLEFGGLPVVRIICDRGVGYELVRHRLCSFAQESTRYCNYKGGVTFVIPPCVDLPRGEYNTAEVNKGDAVFCNKQEVPGLHLASHPAWAWFWHMNDSEECYQRLLREGWSPQYARSVLPNSLKTEVIMAANTREWMHVFKQRTHKTAHPQMREIMVPLAKEFAKRAPILFGEFLNE